MQELLPDNLKELGGMATDHNLSKAKLREVKSLTSWLYSFLAYMAVSTTDRQTREMLAIKGGFQASGLYLQKRDAIPACKLAPLVPYVAPSANCHIIAKLTRTMASPNQILSEEDEDVRQ